MMVERQAQMGADVGQFRWADSPGFAGQFHGTEIWLFRCGKSRGGATGPHDIGVKAGVVGGDEAGASEKWLDLGPEFAERGFTGHLLPGNTVNVAENKMLARSSDQAVFPVGDGVIFHPDDGNRAGTILSVVRRFKIQRHKTVRFKLRVSPRGRTGRRKSVWGWYRCVHGLLVLAQADEQIPEVCEMDAIQRNLPLVIRGDVNAGEAVLRGEPRFKNAILENLMAKEQQVMCSRATGIKVVTEVQRFIAELGRGLPASRKDGHGERLVGAGLGKEKTVDQAADRVTAQYHCFFEPDAGGPG